MYVHSENRNIHSSLLFLTCHSQTQAPHRLFRTFLSANICTRQVKYKKNTLVRNKIHSKSNKQRQGGLSYTLQAGLQQLRLKKFLRSYKERRPVVLMERPQMPRIQLIFDGRSYLSYLPVFFPRRLGPSLPSTDVSGYFL
jgi:hypothetical protein